MRKLNCIVEAEQHSLMGMLLDSGLVFNACQLAISEIRTAQPPWHHKLGLLICADPKNLSNVLFSARISIGEVMMLPVG